MADQGQPKPNTNPVPGSNPDEEQDKQEQTSQ